MITPAGADHALDDAVPIIEAQLAEMAPRLSVIDRSMVLRSIKRIGRELDEAGRAIAVVPMDIWSWPLAAAGDVVVSNLSLGSNA